MREWESHFTREYGWPIYAEYRYRLMPHGIGMTHSERLRAARAFSRPANCMVAPARHGALPPRKSFLEVVPGGVQLSALRRKTDGSVELRVVEVEGRRHETALTLGFPAAAAAETNLLGSKVADAALKHSTLRSTMEPWKIHTFALT